MKSSSGRARGAAHIAAPASLALRSVSPRVTSRSSLVATAVAGFGVTLCGIALLIVPGTPAFAQKTDVVSHAPAVRDATPDADTSIAQKNWDAALAELNARIAQNPRDAQARFKRGTVLARMGRTDDAIAAFTELTQAYPELPEPYNNLAALLAKEGRYGDARVALETATKANPGYGLAFENLGDLYLRMAAQAYRRAQSLGTASATMQQRLADLEKIVSPPKSAAASPAPASDAAGDYTTRATSNITETPAFQFGGPNGSLAIPPYMAPSR
ncbi:tetratricopeptide repeat protein [Paraburkholderia rhizosphaerae]|uniref:Tetratricopeptide repeat protein n=1 Tax=Paraburkholderia rhizosphaerae TaxID=480658 RepID=A0A4R8LKG8_9BURK|nr:tetratricopeptide repeat protein [Paraburkholderia rhizosphaerae]TDY45057.1 tetratricopeptide repeat protein [Paraburkholderia rhizosphaerae]